MSLDWSKELDSFLFHIFFEGLQLIKAQSAQSISKCSNSDWTLNIYSDTKLNLVCMLYTY